MPELQVESLTPLRTTGTSPDFEKWKAYWIVYCGVLLTDELAETILTYFPFYFSARSAFCYWLYHNNGAQYLTQYYLLPLWRTGVDAVTKVDQIVSTTRKTSFDFIKASSDITPEIARFRLNRILQKLRDESRFNESCQNMLKSLILRRESNTIIVSKEERGLREDIEKCERKIKILIDAERRYRMLINWYANEETLKTSAKVAMNNSKINAILQVKIQKISMPMSPASPSKQKNDIFAVINVNDFPKGKTTPMLSQIRDETFEIPVDRLTNRIEIQVYQISFVGRHEIIAFCWFTVGELREELLDKYLSVFPVDVQESKLSLEPCGYLNIKVNLIEQTRIKQSNMETDFLSDLQDDDIYLTEDIRRVYTRNGHQFQIFKGTSSLASDVIGARCSVCEESMIGEMRCCCQRCAFACHIKCFKGVMTKCINHDDIHNAPIGADLNTGQLLDYNRPHLIEVKTLNLLRSWCTHCGLKVLMGERLLQCSKCGKCAHDKCRALVPNFCGLSLADAAAIAIKEQMRERQRPTLNPPDKVSRYSIGDDLKVKIAQIIDSQEAHWTVLALTAVDMAMVVADIMFSIQDRCGTPAPAGTATVFQLYEVQSLLDLVSTSILVLFTVEMLMRLYVSGINFYACSVLHSVDAAIVVVSWISEVFFSDSQWLGKFLSLIVIGRAWRIVRIGDAVALIVSESAEDTITKLKEEIAALKEHLKQKEE
ncbi:Serine/threonine kinase [Entophlyctis luteolus]|nr:Serine/threonine kinase [Entophlyctis luteolus]